MNSRRNSSRQNRRSPHRNADVLAAVLPQHRSDPRTRRAHPRLPVIVERGRIELAELVSFGSRSGRHRPNPPSTNSEAHQQVVDTVVSVDETEKPVQTESCAVLNLRALGSSGDLSFRRNWPRSRATTTGGDESMSPPNPKLTPHQRTKHKFSTMKIFQECLVEMSGGHRFTERRRSRTTEFGRPTRGRRAHFRSSIDHLAVIT